MAAKRWRGCDMTDSRRQRVVSLTPARQAAVLKDATAVVLPARHLEKPQAWIGILNEVTPAPHGLAVRDAARRELARRDLNEYILPSQRPQR